jgi:D-glycerate 3-kinase
VTAIAQKLQSPPYSLQVVVISIDDFYLGHEDQIQLAKSHPDNPLVQHRGQPSTHDVGLLEKVFKDLRLGEPTQIPQYDKSCFNGQGDRVNSDRWESVNDVESKRVNVVIFEGWCVGFRPLTDEQLKKRWTEACSEKDTQKSDYRGRLGWNKFEDIKFINDTLRDYQSIYK